MKTKPPSLFFSRFVKSLFVVWILSIFIFAVLIYFSPNNQVNDSTGLPVIIDILIGTVSFGLLILVFAAKTALDTKTLTVKRSFKGITVFALKFLGLLMILPIFLFWKILKDRKTKLVGRIIQAGLVALLLLPFWTMGYFVVGTIGAEQLGYTTEPIPVSGTGSMYPTFPKGETKTPQEQSKEVVGTPGMIPYPNGLVLFGTRIFGHKLGRGDIVVVENEKIKELTKELTGQETGWVKRIVALQGDELEIRDGIFYLNGEAQKEPYIARARSTFGETFLKECTKVKVPDGHIFVMGDNRKGSGDSREVGFIAISSVNHALPFSKQKGTLDANWRDTSSDLDASAKIKLNAQEYLDLLNNKRKEAGVKPIKYQLKLEDSAFRRGEVILKYDDFSFEATRSGYTPLKAMSDANYSNIVYGEAPTLGYYEASELLDNQFEFPDTQKFLLNSDYQEVGIAEVEGNLNGCPSQVIIQHFAGYIPPNYKKEDIDGWKTNLSRLKEIQSGWAGLKKYQDFYEKNKTDVDRINEIISTRIVNISAIVTRMESNQWLNSAEQKMVEQDKALYDEQEAIATRLNSF